MWWLAYLTMGLLMFVGLLLMVIILLQRGRGGGLAGAFGGAGGQSAFGTRAGDVFTKITAIMAIIWVFLAGVSRFALEPAANQAAREFMSEAEMQDESNPDGAIKATDPPDKTGLAPPPGKTTPMDDDAKAEKNTAVPVEDNKDGDKTTPPNSDDALNKPDEKKPEPNKE